MEITVWSEGGNALLFNHTISCKEFLELTAYEFGSVVWSGSMDVDEERKTSSANF